MGGGDLNLKKSWHPNTLKNQKRVYEAEQANAAEKRKLQELQREIQNERNFEEMKKFGQKSGVLAADEKNRLEWMYKGAESSLNREEYLTGRAVDKHFEEQDKNERQKDPSNLVGVTVPKNHVEHECIPFSIRAFRGAPVNEDQVDMQRKIMEDPLMMIQQREMETRQKLLQNPVKLKEIHRLLQADKKLKESSLQSKKKKSKKSKKKRSHSDTDGSDDDLDSQLAKKYKQLLGDKGEKSGSMNIDKLLNEKYEKLSSELDKIKKSKKKEKNDKGKPKKKRRDNSSSSSSSSDSSDSSSNDGKKKHSKERERRDPIKNRSDRNFDRRQREYSPPQRNRFNRKSRSPVRNDRSRENQSRYNGKDFHGDNRRRSRSPRFNDRGWQTGRRPQNYSPKGRRNSPIGRRNSPIGRRNSPIGRRNSPIGRRNSPIGRRNSPIGRKNSPMGRKNSPIGRRNSPIGRRNSPIDRNRNNRRGDDRDNNRNRPNYQSNRYIDRKRSRSRSLSPRRKPRKHSHSRSRSRSPESRIKDSKQTLFSTKKRSKSPEKAKFGRESRENERREPERAIRTAAPPPKRSSRSSSSSGSSDSDSDSGDDKRPAPKNFGLVTASGEKIEVDRKYESKNIPATTQKKPTSTFVPASMQSKKKLTDEQKNARLREMQQNAEWHDKELHVNRMRNEERAKRETELEKNTEFDRNYIHKEMHKALTSQDVEARLKSNKNNIQRMSSSMHSHFAKK